MKVIQNQIEKTFFFEGEVLLSELLVRYGYTVPHICGGRGSCGKCKVRCDGKECLSCRTLISRDAVVELPDCEEMQIITVAGTGQLSEQMCLCLDIGTTTLVLALVSRDGKCIVDTLTAANPQRIFGADVISRIDYATKNGADKLQRVLLNRLREMTSRLLDRYGLQSVEHLYVTGNTTMLHLFYGEDCSGLGVSPYTPMFLNERSVAAERLGIQGAETVILMAGFAAFVGADLVSGIRHIGLPKGEKYCFLVDLGTNAEIALIGKEDILCTAAAAGPCFEGANISCGMSAVDGAVCGYDGENYTVIGGGAPKGLCATGLIDVIAHALDKGDIEESGYAERDIVICDDVSVTQKDIREFQLAKSAVRAAMECLLKRKGITFEQVEALYVTGGFSAGLRAESAVRVGLLPEALQGKLIRLGNAALMGAMEYACGNHTLLPPARYVELSADVTFSELFMEYMCF